VGFCVFFGPGSGVKIWEKPEPDPGHFSISAVAGVCVVSA